MLCASPTIALADYQEVHARLLCNDSAAMVQFVNGSNGEPPNYPTLPEIFAEKFENATEFPEMECDVRAFVSQQQMLRIKIGNDQKTTSGACGAGLRAFFSLWIGGHKVISKKYFYNSCRRDQFHIDAMVFYGETLLFCAYPNTNRNWVQSEPHDPVQPVCINVSELYATAINSPKDEVEYPPNGSERREGHIELVSSSNNDLCSQIEVSAKQSRYFVEFSDEITAPDRPAQFDHSTYERFAPYPYIVDINNDGFMDMVGVKSRGHHGEDNYISMLIDGALTPVTIDSDIPSRNSAIPLILGGPSDSSDNSYYLSIFMWQNETYVYLSGLYREPSPDSKVMQMQPDGSSVTICELDYVTINF